MMEWLESDGRGGFAMGSVSGIPMRRYHSLLTAAVGSPARRVNIISAVQATVELDGKSYILTPFMFHPGIVRDDGLPAMRAFSYKPWPMWLFEIENGLEIKKEILISRDPPLTLLRWSPSKKFPQASLKLRLLFSGRDYHGLHHANPDFNFNHTVEDGVYAFKPYESLPGVKIFSNGNFQPEKNWFNGIWYQEDKERGADYLEDLAAPGVFTFSLNGPAVFMLSAENYKSSAIFSETPKDPLKIFNTLSAHEMVRREKLAAPLEFAADQYIVKRAEGKTIIAGFPWFADWGRDTFISMRGLCLAMKRFEEAENILVQWSKTISQGMLPNRFLEEGETPEYNSVDASLWYIIACADFLELSAKSGAAPKPAVQDILLKAIDEILDHYIKGTRYNIKRDPLDGLLSAGQEGIQITWMDAKIGDYVVTPRIGKPVEIQALWINALHVAGALLKKHKKLHDEALKSFGSLFWNSSKNALFDVCDVNHVKGQHDPAIRPNQIFAVGGLPLQIVSKEIAAKVVKTVEDTLLTPHGLRTLAPGQTGYRDHYKGGSYDRDTAYHQGTVWPWLMGPFIEAWVRINGETREARAEARRRFLAPILKTVDEAGLGHLSEIHDGNFPHLHRGCPFQAWSVGEALRVDRLVLNDRK